MTKSWKISRRHMLRGVGASLALPYLDIMGASSARAEAAGPPTRLACVFQPNGVFPAAWDVSGVGRDYKMSTILAPLEKLRDDVTIISNLDNNVGGDHVAMTSSFLTGAGVRNGRARTSLDMQVARHIGRDSRFQAIQLGTEPPRQGAAGGNAIALANTVTWSSDSTRVSPEINPRVAFDRLFREQTGDAAQRRAANRKSVLDLVREDAKSLRLQASHLDQHKIDEYLEGVRSVEQQIDRAMNPRTSDWTPITAPNMQRPPAGIPRRRDEHLRLMIDLLVLALWTDTTRVATLMTAHGFSRQNFSFLEGVTNDHHGMSHHGNKADAIEQYTHVSKWYIQQFAYMLNRMKAIDEGNGSLLDNTIVLYGSGMKDGNGHRKANLPILLAGRGGGRLKPAGHVEAKPRTPLANLHLTILQRLGIETESFNGVSNGDLNGII